jgi:ABC-type lipoprotein export system ATPase subunit
MKTDFAIRIRNLNHLFDSPSRRFLVTVDALKIPMGKLTTFLGSSGCGKSTVLNRIGLLRGTENDVHSNVETFDLVERTENSFVTHNIAKLSNQGPGGRKKIEAIRRKLMGFFLQAGELLPTLNLLENVAMPLRLDGVCARDAEARARELLGFLLNISTNSIPNKLAGSCSGGEYQRIALARAVAHRPQILLVDEPTSSLDTPNKHRVFELMMQLVRHENTTVVMISHDVSLARQYSNFCIHFETSPSGWADRIPFQFRDECDGFGQATRYEAKVSGKWLRTNADFQINNNERNGIYVCKNH